MIYTDLMQEYIDGCDAIIRQTPDGYEIETPEETYHYRTYGEMLEDISYTVSQWRGNNGIH